MNRSIAGWVAHRWTKWVVLVLSVVLLGTMASLGAKLATVQEDDIASWLPGDAESTKVIEQSAQFSDPDAIPAVVLYVRESGITPADLAKATADGTEIAKIDGVSDKIIGPIPSKDGKALQVIATINMGSDGWEKLPDVVDDMNGITDKDANGLDTQLAGPAALGADQAKAFAGIDGILLLSAVAIVFVILLITYRSLQLAILFLLCGVGAVLIAQGVVYLLAKYADLTVNGQSAGILSVLVLGAGVDYALLLVARYREELHNYEDRHEAMAHALHRAAPAVLASGATVIIGLLCLLFAQMNSTSSLGPVGAAGIACALLVMMITLPALLLIFGRWIFWPFIPRFGDPLKSETGLWAKVGQRITKRPRVVWVATSLVLIALTFGVTQLGANGLSNEDSFTKAQPSVAAEKKLSEHFPSGAGSPVAVTTKTAQADAVAEALGEVEGIDPSTIEVKGDSGGTSYIEGALTSAPDSKAAFDTIDEARDAVHAVDGADALVGGNTAINKDVQGASSADNKLIIPIILVVVLLVLAVLLRSIAAPMILLVTVVVSFGAALGISGFVFNNVFGFAGADSSFPLFAFVFLVALGIDYNIFLMTRVREEALKHGTRRGALIGLAATGGVITSAGFVLAGTFAALATLPIVFLAELGFAVAVGVLLDTIIVRSVLVTALNLDIGRHIWWPSALAKKEDVPVSQAGDDAIRTRVDA
ncbi:MMPL family transporter [Aeromicrobium sp.]|uniref:MMPL family transporter n=1 Tax=Aeromicrobium sp. TaxID=1871063 RepID=UPI0030BC8172